MAGRSARGARPAARAPDQHFLRSARLAEAIVRCADVERGDLVVEIGAGTGRLTVPLAERAARVRAIELDPLLAARLRTRLGNLRHVQVIEGDALRVPLPNEWFRVVANLPFGRTGAILRRLLDDRRLPLARADVIVEWGVAIGCTACWPSSMLGITRGALYEFRIARRLPSACFEPRPAVDAALLSVPRRQEPLVPEREYEAFRAFVRRGFCDGRRLREALGIPSLRFKRLAAELGFDRAARARELDLYQWVELHSSVRGLR